MSPDGYVKIYESILDSSVWAEPATTRCVWLALLAMVDAEGRVEASPSGLARRANVTLAECRKATDTLEAPDLESKSPEWGGRRIEKVEGGWVILNYKKYRDRRSPKQIADAKRQQKWREDHPRGRDVTECDVTPGHAPASAATSTATSASKKGGEKRPPRKTGEAALLLAKIRALAEQNQSSGQGAVRFIRRERVTELGADVAVAYDAIGGADRVLSAAGKEHSFLARDFADALEAARA